MEVIISGKRIRLDPTSSVGKGGEADIFSDGKRAIKIFKPPSHPDFQGFPEEQKAAKERLKEHQKKLPAFPKNLPTHVVTPKELVYDSAGKIIGYTMVLLKNAELLWRFGEKDFRKKGVSNQAVVSLFQDLHQTVSLVHRAGVVIGDFNDLNVLVVREKECYLVDADSFQFGSFWCRLFNVRFLDPLLCDLQTNQLAVLKPPNPNSDWYAFAIMLMQSLLFAHPYDGVYLPKNPKKRLVHDLRPLKRITVFHPEVVYPKPAIPYRILPDDLLHFLEGTFVKDQRGPFPFPLLVGLRWTACRVCGQEHCRSLCPYCQKVAPSAVKEVITVQGRVTASRLFKSQGVILYATYQKEQLLWLYHENNQFKREDGRAVVSGKLSYQMRFRIQGTATLIGQKNEVYVFSAKTSKPSRLFVDASGNLPMFDVNAQKRFWLYGGWLWSEGKLGPDYPERIGEVLSGQTMFWVGPKFGFGFYRAGNLNIAFVFDTERRGINDQVKMPPFPGQLVAVTCVFTEERCWFFCASENKGKIINRSIVIRADGSVEALEETTAHDGSWLGTIRGKVSFGHFLFAATDAGVVRVEPAGGRLAVSRIYPDTEPFVDEASKLFVGQGGLYVVNQKEIYLLQLK